MNRVDVKSTLAVVPSTAEEFADLPLPWTLSITCPAMDCEEEEKAQALPSSEPSNLTKKNALMLVIDTQLLNDSRLVEPVLEFLNILPKDILLGITLVDDEVYPVELGHSKAATVRSVEVYGRSGLAAEDETDIFLHESSTSATGGDFMVPMYKAKTAIETALKPWKPPAAGSSAQPSDFALGAGVEVGLTILKATAQANGWSTVASAQAAHSTTPNSPYDLGPLDAVTQLLVFCRRSPSTGAARLDPVQLCAPAKAAAAAAPLGSHGGLSSSIVVEAEDDMEFREPPTAPARPSTADIEAFIFRDAATGVVHPSARAPPSVPIPVLKNTWSAAMSHWERIVKAATANGTVIDIIDVGSPGLGLDAIAPLLAECGGEVAFLGDKELGSNFGKQLANRFIAEFPESPADSANTMDVSDDLNLGYCDVTLQLNVPWEVTAVTGRCVGWCNGRQWLPRMKQPEEAKHAELPDIKTFRVVQSWCSGPCPHLSLQCLPLSMPSKGQPIQANVTVVSTKMTPRGIQRLHYKGSLALPIGSPVDCALAFDPALAALHIVRLASKGSLRSGSGKGRAFIWQAAADIRAWCRALVSRLDRGTMGLAMPATPTSPTAAYSPVEEEFPSDSHRVWDRMAHLLRLLFCGCYSPVLGLPQQSPDERVVAAFQFLSLPPSAAVECMTGVANDSMEVAAPWSLWEDEEGFKAFHRKLS